MLRRLVVSAALVASAFVPAATLPAAAVTQGATVTATASCTYQRSGDHWNCVTPGAYCPAAAHGRYGYAKATNRRYRCSQYPNGQWRWKRA
ncbi:hypothetical protein AB0395_17185 [Streptosporangium sp. NPDC051023]|uniref:hypothetical protein n=1 Tax=Streptosporangium sp. NPDC051023 TaxID=3155410 RepID=UPI0034508DD7